MISPSVLFEEFAGRDEELRHVVDVHARSARTGKGAVVSISGESGIGKSRFLTEIANAVARDRGVFVRVRCEELPVAFAPIGAAVRALAERPELRRKGVMTAALARLTEARAERAFDAAEYHAATIGIVTTAFGEAAHRLGRLTIAVDDVQWSDMATLDALCSLARGTEKNTVILLFAYRPADLAHDHARGAIVAKLEREGADRLTLAGLPFAAMNRLLRRTVPHAPAETIRRIFDLSEGRPYVAEELARSFAERGAAFDQTAGLPLRSAILNRLEELSPSERGIVERASVLGRNFRPNDLFDIDSPPGEVRAALRAGVALQLFEEHEVAERPWFRFRHALTREIIYREIRSDERRALHLAMADHFEPLNDRAAEFAYHVSAAGDAYRAGPANERAADGVANIAASSDAATLYAKALEFTSEPDDLVRIARKYVAALRSVSDVEQLAREIPPLAKRLVAGDRVDDATDILITSADAVGSLDFARAQGLLDQIDAQLSERTPAHQRFVFELLRARFLVDQSRYDEAQEACRRAETALKTQPQPTSRDRLTLMRILALCSRDDVIAAKVHAEYERVLRTQDWDTADEATCLAIIGIAEFDALQVRLGFEHLAEAARIRERTRGGHFMWTYQTAAYMAAEAGDFAFTKAALERLEREGREVGDDLGQGLSRLIRACGGDVRPCLQGLDRARKLRSWSYAGGYAADLAFTYEETPERARKIAVDTFDAMPPGSVAKSDLIQAVVAFGSFEEASRAIDAIPFDSEIDHVRFRLTTLLARARFARRQQRLVAAKLIAAEALEIALPSGAWVYTSAAFELSEDVERARDVLATVGATAELERFDRRHTIAGANATSHAEPAPKLTRREEQIARAIADGASSREVAERLAIAPRTVDAHVANIYEKLGVNSRLQLAKLLE